MISQYITFPTAKRAELLSRELPALAPGEWMLRSETSLVSTGTELIVFNGEFDPGSHWDNWVQWPVISVGYNLIGRVEAVGEGVSDVQIGERYAVRMPHASRHIMSKDSFAGWVRVPESIPSADAVWFGMATIAQIGFRRAELKLGDNIAIIGAGLLGQLITQYARLAGADDIIMIDTAPARLEMARSHGATHAFQGTAEQAHEVVYERTNGRGADVVFDVTGHPSAFSAGLKLAREFGTLLLLGDAPKPSEQRLTGDVVTRGVKIVGGHDGYPQKSGSGFEHWSHREMTRLFLTYLERRQMNVGDLVTHRFDYSEAASAFPMLLADRSKAMGVLFDWTKAQ